MVYYGVFNIKIVHIKVLLIAILFRQLDGRAAGQLPSTCGPRGQGGPCLPRTAPAPHRALQQHRAGRSRSGAQRRRYPGLRGDKRVGGKMTLRLPEPKGQHEATHEDFALLRFEAPLDAGVHVRVEGHPDDPVPHRLHALDLLRAVPRARRPAQPRRLTERNGSERPSAPAAGPDGRERAAGPPRTWQ